MQILAPPLKLRRHAVDYARVRASLRMTVHHMKIVIVIKEKTVKVVLFDGKKQKDLMEIVEEYNLSKKLLPGIEKLLKRNKLSKKDVLSVRVESDQGENFTTTRIAKTIAETWNFACE